MGLDRKYIREAEAAKSFNINTADLEKKDYKEEIRYLIEAHTLKVDKNTRPIAFQDYMRVQRVNNAIIKLKANRNFDDLFNLYNDRKGIGPGEVMLYYIVTNAVLGGQNSKGVDLIIGSSKYEVKAVSTTGNAPNMFAYNFTLGSLGSSIRAIDIIKHELDDLAKQCGEKPSAAGNITKTIIDAVRVKEPDKLKVIEQKYANICVDQYFKNHKTIFLYNNNPSDKGKIASVKQVTADDISIYRISSYGGIEPRIKL